MNVSNLLTYLLKIYLTYFMALFSFYTIWNTSENQRFPDVFRVHGKWPVPWKGLRIIYFPVTCFGTYIRNSRLNRWKASYKMKLLIFLILMLNFSPIYVDKIIFILLTILLPFFPVWNIHNLLLSCIICLLFCFGCVFVVHTPRIYLSEIKVKFTCFSLWTYYYFEI